MKTQPITKCYLATNIITGEIDKSDELHKYNDDLHQLVEGWEHLEYWVYSPETIKRLEEKIKYWKSFEGTCHCGAPMSQHYSNCEHVSTENPVPCPFEEELKLMKTQTQNQFEVPPFDAGWKKPSVKYFWWSWNPFYPKWSKSCWGGDTIEEAMEVFHGKFCCELKNYHNKLIREGDSEGVFVEVCDVPCPNTEKWIKHFTLPKMNNKETMVTVPLSILEKLRDKAKYAITPQVTFTGDLNKMKDEAYIIRGSVLDYIQGELNYFIPN